MVKITKIYTKTGDKGSTHLVGGKLISKSSLRIQSYGELDELNAVVGLCSTLATHSPALEQIASELIKIQHELFNLGAELASDPECFTPNVNTVDSPQVHYLESRIDHMVSILPQLNSFVLPGGTELNSHLHIARTICRRVERTVCKLAESESVRDCVLSYLNRLSDYLFALSRFIIHTESDGKEVLWQPDVIRNQKED